MFTFNLLNLSEKTEDSVSAYVQRYVNHFNSHAHEVAEIVTNAIMANQLVTIEDLWTYIYAFDSLVNLGFGRNQILDLCTNLRVKIKCRKIM